MIAISKEFREKMNENRVYTAKLGITLIDGTVLNVGAENIIDLKLEDAVSGNDTFDIGSCIINSLNISIANINDEYSDYNFAGAEIIPFITLKGMNEWIKKGVYTVDTSISAGGIISISAYDNMNLLDKEYKKSTLEYPSSIYEIVLDISRNCNFSISNIAFDNRNYVIQRKPNDENLTFRMVLSYCMQICGCWAKFDKDGRLSIDWYKVNMEDNIDGGIYDKKNEEIYETGVNIDGGTFEFEEGEKADGGLYSEMKNYHNIYVLESLTVDTDDIQITGIRVKASGTQEDHGEAYLYGEEGYVLEIEGNPLIIENTAQPVATFLGKKICGMRFRKFNASMGGDISIESGDMAYINSRKCDAYSTCITNYTFNINKICDIRCSAESVSKNNSQRYSSSTIAYQKAIENAEYQISTYDKAVQQLNDLLAHSFGVYKTEEIQEDGSVIFYMHDKPTLANSLTIWKQTADAFAVSKDGGLTYTAGFDSKGNAVLNVLNAIGVNADWINVGTLTGRAINNGNGTFQVDEEGNVIANSLISNNATITGGTIDIESNSGKIGIKKEGYPLAETSCVNIDPEEIMLEYVGAGRSKSVLSSSEFEISSIVGRTEISPGGIIVSGMGPTTRISHTGMRMTTQSGSLEYIFDIDGIVLKSTGLDGIEHYSKLTATELIVDGKKIV